jgi:hypothetical protein
MIPPQLSVVRILTLLFILAGCASAGTGDLDASQASEDPRDYFDRMAQFVSSTQQFRTTVRMGFDVLQDWGQKIEFSERHRITIVRPDRLRADILKSHGEAGVVLFDGQKVTAYNRTLNVFAQADKTGSIDEVLDYFLRDLQMRLPLALMFRSDFPEEIEQRLEALVFIEVSAVTDVPCVHLAGRTDEIDFEIWIPETGDPLPVRLTITYRDEEGQPKFWADFESWDLKPAIADADFTFTPSEGAERIPFLVEIETAHGIEKPKGDD